MAAALAFNITIEDAGLSAALKRTDDQVLYRMLPSVWQALMLLEREIVDLMPSASGTTRTSVQVQRPEILGNVIEGEVGSPLQHVEYLELGTKPHRPPVAPIEAWVSAKFHLSGIEATRVAYAVVEKIAKVGTEGAFMFKTAFERNEDHVVRILKEGIRTALREAGLMS